MIDYNVISDPHVGVVAVEVSVEVEGRTWVATGSSKCDPGDDFRFETGVQIALGRALKKLGGKVERAGHKYVAKADAVNDDPPSMAVLDEAFKADTSYWSGYRQPTDLREADAAAEAGVLMFADDKEPLWIVSEDTFRRSPYMYRVPFHWKAP